MPLLAALLLGQFSAAAEEDPWAFTAEELRRCRTIQVGEKDFLFEMTVPATGYYKNRTIWVNDAPYIALGETFLGSIDGARKDALKDKRRIIVYEKDLLVVDAGIQLHYFYYYYQEGGQECVCFKSGIKSLEDCLFRVKCAKSLRHISAEASRRSAAGSTVDVGIPAGDYPRMERVWVDATGKYKTAARLVSYADGTALLRKTADGKPVTMSIFKLDEAARLIAADAEPHFALERAIRAVLEETRPRSSADALARPFRNAIDRAHRALSSRHPLPLRYRIIGVSEELPPQHTRSRRGEFRLSLRPLFQIDAVPEKWEGGRLVATYRSEWHVAAEDFSPDQVEVNKTVLGFYGAKPILNGGGHDHDLHFQLKFESEETPVITVGFDHGSHRLFTPGVAAATGAVEMVFAAAPTAKEVARAEPKVATAPTTVSGEPPAAAPLEPRVPHGGAPPEEPRETFAVTGASKSHTFICDGHDVAVTGTLHEVQITGRCRKLTVAGSGNKVSVEVVGTISVAGSLNEIKYVGGPDGRPPEIRAGRNNKVEQVTPPTEAPRAADRVGQRPGR
jgi:hypothetical protein